MKLSGLVCASCLAGPLPSAAAAAAGRRELSLRALLDWRELSATLAAPGPASAESAFRAALDEMERVARLLAGHAFAALPDNQGADGLPEDVADALAQAGSIASALGDENGRARLAGLAAGYVLDAGALALRKQGLRHCLLSWKGAVRAMGGRADGSPWEVKGVPLEKKLLLREGGAAVALSPGGSGPAFVVVTGPNAACAAGMAHAALALDPRAAARRVEEAGALQCAIGSRDGRLISSRGFGGDSA